MYIPCGNGGNVPNPSVLNAAQINGARSVATRCVRFAAAPKELCIETRSSNSALAQGFSELSADPIVESKGYECRQNPLISAEKSSLTTWGKMSEELDVLFHNVNFSHYKRTTFSHTRGQVSFKFPLSTREGQSLKLGSCSKPAVFDTSTL